jgi:hypothetical protein
MNPDLERNGFVLVPSVLDTVQLAESLSALGSISGAGRRGLLAVPAVAALARSPRVLNLIRPHLPLEPVPVLRSGAVT